MPADRVVLVAGVAPRPASELRDRLSGIAATVLVVESAPATLARPLAATDAPTWDASCEQLLRDALGALQRAWRAVEPRGGRIVVVVPTVGMTGHAGLVPLATAIEGVRAMVRSAARQWGPAGITINCVGAPIALLAPDHDGPAPYVTDPALGALVPTLDDVVAAVRMLFDADAPITGTTVVVDGGVVMTP